MHNSQISEGDIGFTQLSDKKYYPFKILKIETWPDNSIVWHVLNYEAVDSEPTEADIKNFKIIAWHAPIDSFEKDAKFITNIPVINEELKGYFEYLKQTNFRRYIQESGENLDTIIKEAQLYYKKAIELDKNSNQQEAIKAYTRAVEIFPLFYEAIDNRAICYLDLRSYKEAINDFQNSLKLNPNNFTAQFGLGYSYYQIKEYALAKKETEKSLNIKDDSKASGLLRKIEEKLI